MDTAWSEALAPSCNPLILLNTSDNGKALRMLPNALMTQLTQQHPIDAMTEVHIEPCRHTLFDNERAKQLSQTLRAHARVVRERNSNAYIYHRSELAQWLGKDVGLLDEVLEFMLAEGCAGTIGLSDTWWIT
jgi:hypothetical protein